MGLETTSIGYIIDKILNLKGYKIGQSSVSLAHANFITTATGAKAKDVADIIDYIKQTAKEKLGLELHEEVVRVGI